MCEKFDDVWFRLVFLYRARPAIFPLIMGLLSIVLFPEMFSLVFDVSRFLGTMCGSSLLTFAVIGLEVEDEIMRRSPILFVIVMFMF